MSKCVHEIVELLWVDEFCGVGSVGITECMSCGAEVEVEMS